MAGIGHALGGAHYTFETRERSDDELLDLVDDASFMALVDNIPENDREKLEISKQNIRSLKMSIYKSRGKLPKLIKQAQEDYQKEQQKAVNNLNIRYIFLIMVIGAALQIISYLLR